MFNVPESYDVNSNILIPNGYAGYYWHPSSGSVDAKRVPEDEVVTTDGLKYIVAALAIVIGAIMLADSVGTHKQNDYPMLENTYDPVFWVGISLLVMGAAYLGYCLYAYWSDDLKAVNAEKSMSPLNKK